MPLLKTSQGVAVAGVSSARGARGSGLVSDLAAVLSPDQVSTRLEDRLVYGRDMWPRGLLAVAAGKAPEHPPEVVVWPACATEVQAVVGVCRAHRTGLVPFGAGSGVCGGAVARGGVVLDLKRMRRLCQVDASRGSATFEPGILGAHLEQELNRQGFTLGHFPSSIMCSTAGGWLATRGAGQCSTRYGKIEDMVRSIEVVTGTGKILEVDGGGGGADLLQLLVGSEGTLGIITRATCAVRRLPEARRMRGWSFPQVISGCAAIQKLLQAGLRPAVVRLYDELDTLISSARSATTGGAADGAVLEVPERPAQTGGAGEGRLTLSLDDWLEMLRPDAQRARHGVQRWLLGRLLSHTRALNRIADRVLPRLSGGCLLILGFEGDEALSAAEERAAGGLLGAAGGRDLGPGPGEHWLRHRYDVSFKMPRAFAAGAFVDTMEVATTWDRLDGLYHRVREAVAPHAFVMAHFSHAYAEGCSIYFTFAGRRSDLSASRGGAEAALREDEGRYDALWEAALGAVVGAGATISHHHGIGRLKAGFMKEEHGASMAIFRELKEVLDPDHILNPGKLGLGGMA